MATGKDRCKVLSDIRKQIADANGIRYEVRECTHKGDCAGTCARCDAEVQYLENELLRRQSLGKAVKIAGLATVTALSVAACTPPEPGDLMGEPAVPRVEVDSLPGVWRIMVIADSIVSQDLHPTLTFGADGTIKVSSGCNTLEGRFTIGEIPEQMFVTWGGVTEIFCADEALRAMEERLFALLTAQDELRVITDDYSNKYLQITDKEFNHLLDLIKE